MFNCIKSLFKINLKDHYRPPRLFTLMKILKTPSQAVLNGSAFDETILIIMNTSGHHLMYSIGQDFG